MHDVLVVGAGPAGLAVAIGAAHAGLDVAVVERRAGVQDKACGEGLMPGALRALQRLGVDPPGEAIRGISYRQDELVVRTPFRAGAGRGVRRTTLHADLLAATHDAGVSVHRRSVISTVHHPDHVVVDDLAARYLVAADGLHSPLRAAAGLTRTRRGPARWGMRQHFQAAPRDDHVEVHWVPGAEAYVTPVAPDVVGVAILSGERGSFDAKLAAFGELAGWLGDAEPISSVRGAGPLRQDCSSRIAGRMLLVGDAAGYLDALTGEGLALALAGAEELVACLRSGHPERYERAWQRRSRQSRWLTGGLLWARQRPALAPRIVPLCARVPRVFGAVVDRLAG